MQTTLILLDLLGIILCGISSLGSYYNKNREAKMAWIVAAIWAFVCLLKDLK